MKKIVMIICIVMLTLPFVYGQDKGDDYEMFVNHGSIMLIIDPDTGDIVFANLAAADFYMCTVEEMHKKNISEINTLTPGEIANEMAMAKLQERNYFNFKHRICEGDVRDVEVYSYPVKYNGNEMLFSIIIDVTERNLTEKALKESQEREKDNLMKVVYASVLIVIVFAVLTGIIYHSNRKLEYLTKYDPLTKVYNRRVTEENYYKLQAKQADIKVVMVDVNNLKFINDTFGHIAGDKMIQKVARYLLNYFDEKDIVSRVSGDEFVVLSSSVLSPETIEKDIGEQRFLIGNVSFDVSAGCIISGHEMTYEQAFSNAETRMYSLKVSKKEKSLLRIKNEIMTLYTHAFKDAEHEIKMVTKIAGFIAENLDMNKDDMDDLLEAARFQNISMGIIDQKEDMKTHPEKSYSILCALGVKYSVANTVLCHHELYDGSGYPKGIHGKEIPYSARILGIANAIYSRLDEDVVNYLNQNKESHFDKMIVEEVIDQGLEKFLNTLSS
ncbi:diguanylate cyclase [Acidaminobacter sp. JC074]|uniref:sensor domain-containing diguanylate cyclase/phosphohydrolase n=1 Tax=Acidaminobacter sp. JC074 TaxID=2530199 RepID=UPI001F0F15FE|nr:diguanylate cyclase [Acidaminobacter sp. JC074]MCH4885975.1 diguanylate cyclase [Acidaminobacter sp. JC074]